MIKTSARHAVPLSLVLALVLAPVLRAAIEPKRIEDCADPEAAMDAASIDERNEVDEGPGSIAGHGRRVNGVARQGGDRLMSLTFRIVRAWELPDAIVYPAAVLPGPMAPDRNESMMLRAGDEEIPATLMFEHGVGGVGRLAVYTHLYRGVAIRNPLLARLKNAVGELIFGGPPVTLLLASGHANRMQRQRVQEAAEDWITTTYTHVRRVCAQ